MSTSEIPVVVDDGALIPTRAHPTDAGLDIFTPKAFMLPCHGRYTVKTGIHVQLPAGTCGRIEPKSGLNRDCDIVCWGLIDEGYTGEIEVKLYNLGKQTHWFGVGDKIAQLTVSPVIYPMPVKVDVIEGGPRGASGFGSSGR